MGAEHKCEQKDTVRTRHSNNSGFSPRAAFKSRRPLPRVFRLSGAPFLSPGLGVVRRVIGHHERSVPILVHILGVHWDSWEKMQGSNKRGCWRDPLARYVAFCGVNEKRNSGCFNQNVEVQRSKQMARKQTWPWGNEEEPTKWIAEPSQVQSTSSDRDCDRCGETKGRLAFRLTLKMEPRPNRFFLDIIAPFETRSDSLCY